MNVRKVLGSIAICALLLGLQHSQIETQQSVEAITTTVFTSKDSRGRNVSVDKTPVLKAARQASRPIQPKQKNPHVVENTDKDLNTGKVRKQSIPDCNFFAPDKPSGPDCEIRALVDINPNSPNSANPGGVVQGAGNLLDFKLGNKATSYGNLVGPLHGFFEVPTTWSITGWTTGTNWTCSGTAPVSGGAASPTMFWGIYAPQADPPFNASQNNSVRCAYNGPKLAPGDVTATAVTFSVTVPASTTRWSSFFGASSELLIGFQNGAVQSNYQVINYMTLRYDINGGTGTTPSPELYNVVVANGNQTAASNSGFSKAGFTFGGWSCDNSIGTKQPGQSISWSNADVVCTAIWTPPAFQLSYNAGTGSGTVPTTETGLNSGATPTLAAGTAITPPANQTFSGWNCDNSIGAKNAGVAVTMPAANVICTAQFTPIPTYQLSYNAGTGSGTVPTTETGLNTGATPTLAAGTAITPPANQTFTGWNCDNSIGAKNAGVAVTMPAANVICTAQFTPIPTYQLSYNAGTGSGTVPTTETGLNTGATPTLAAGTAITPPANQTFTGWNCDNSIGAKNAGVTVTMPAANVICTAQYTPITYQLSYNAGTGSGTVPTTETGLNTGATPTLAAGTAITPPANQTFTGWNCDNSIGAKKAGVTVTMPAANVICTAQYTPSESSSSTDVKEATSDNSSGKRGANQILEPLSNDKLTSSSKWKSSSMRLCGPQQSTPNCTRRTLTVEGEGTYVIDTKGRVIFTPEPNFVGNATRVKYQVSDTRGRVVAAAIRISVTDQELPKSGSNSQTMFFIALMLVSLGILQRSILRFRQSYG